MTTVLVADDERGIRDRLAGTLADAGYGVIEAEDGGAAFEKACSEHPDIILLDLMMPVMDGFEVLRRLRQREIRDPGAPSIPVVLLTGLAPEEGEQAALSMGASHYLTKPWEPGMVEAAIRVALREADTGNPQVARLDTPRPAPYQRTAASLPAQLQGEVGGGALTGSLTLVEGPPSSGKTVLCQHLAHQALAEGRSVAYFTSERTVRGLVAHMDTLGLNVSGYVQSGTMLVYPIADPTPGFDPDRLLASLALDIQRLPARYEFIVLDSITFLSSYAQERALISFVSTCKSLCDSGRSILLVVHPELFDRKTLDRLQLLCDAHLSLRFEKMCSKVWTVLEVRKIHAAELGPYREVSFQVVPGLGVQIAPFRKIRI